MHRFGVRIFHALIVSRSTSASDRPSLNLVGRTDARPRVPRRPQRRLRRRLSLGYTGTGGSCNGVAVHLNGYVRREKKNLTDYFY